MACALPSQASEHDIGNVSRIQSPLAKIFLRAREIFPDSRIFILIPGTLHALLAQRINNAAPAPFAHRDEWARGGGRPARQPGATGANAAKVQTGKAREKAKALLH